MKMCYQCFYFLEYTDMCTGNFFEHATTVGNHEPRPPSGTRCASHCIDEHGRWGGSYCYTEDGNWGAECVPCPSKYKIFQKNISCIQILYITHLISKIDSNSI